MSIILCASEYTYSHTYKSICNGYGLIVMMVNWRDKFNYNGWPNTVTVWDRKQLQTETQKQKTREKKNAQQMNMAMRRTRE